MNAINVRRFHHITPALTTNQSFFLFLDDFVGMTVWARWSGNALERWRYDGLGRWSGKDWTVLGTTVWEGGLGRTGLFSARRYGRDGLEMDWAVEVMTVWARWYGRDGLGRWSGNGLERCRYDGLGRWPGNALEGKMLNIS